MVARFFGHHVNQPGRPSFFRTKGGALFPVGTGIKGVSIESLFSRKGETANLDAVRQQQSEAVQHFDAMENTTIHITNNTPHIARLNEGWSQQTPAGFFERSVESAKKALTGVWRLKEIP